MLKDAKPTYETPTRKLPMESESPMINFNIVSLQTKGIRLFINR